MFISSIEDRDKLSLFGEGIYKKFIYEFIKSSEDVFYNPRTYFSKFSTTAEGEFLVYWDKLLDEESKININTANKENLLLLFQKLGISEPLAEKIAYSIIDWRDKDNQLSHPLEAAEDRYYQSLEYPYESKDEAFEVLEELLLVRGVDEEIFEKIKDFITIYGDGKVNINTASNVVLSTLGISDELVEKILTYRAGEDEIEGTEDDNIFLTTAEIVPKLSQRFSLREGEIARLTNVVSQYLTTYSHNFMIECKILLRDKKRSCKITAIFNSEGRILYWREI